MVHLAGLPAGSRPNRAELAAAAECPEQFLSKVLQNLTRAGLITSHRGNTGGFELARSRRTASILEVVEAVEGPIRLNLCLTSTHACERQSWCLAHPVWAEAQQAMVDVLQKATIGDLAQEAAARREASLLPVT
jgi:Rrf2 family protein